MKISIENNICCLEPQGDFKVDAFLAEFLTKVQKERVFSEYGRRGARKAVKTQLVTYELYECIDGNYVFPRGLYELWKNTVAGKVEIEDNSSNKYQFSLDDFKDIEKVLRPYANFDLRPDQTEAVFKALTKKRGIIQLPTGSGKSEIMAACISKLVAKNENIKVLVIEPTDILVTKTSDRFNKYNLNSKTYKEVRDKEIKNKIFDGNVLVSHTVSLLHDLQEEIVDLCDFDAVFWDECQHCQCDTWKALNFFLNNVEYAIGLSALAVDPNKLDSRSVDELTIDEVQVIGSTGIVIYNVSPKFYIDNGILATPVIFQIECNLKESLIDVLDRTDWHALRMEGIESDYRTELTAQAIKLFVRWNRRVLVLVGTKVQAEKIAKLAASKYSLRSKIAISYGGGKSYTVDPDLELKSYKGDIVGAFDGGDFDVLISTSHLDEGIDLSNLDVCILASGGKKDRRIIQRIGRALRLTKTGKYAYIVDFHDTGSRVLERHSKQRMKLFEEIVEVSPEHIFERAFLPYLEKVFYRLEGMLPNGGEK